MLPIATRRSLGDHAPAFRGLVHRWRRHVARTAAGVRAVMVTVACLAGSACAPGPHRPADVGAGGKADVGAGPVADGVVPVFLANDCGTSDVDDLVGCELRRAGVRYRLVDEATVRAHVDAGAALVAEDDGEIAGTGEALVPLLAVPAWAVAATEWGVVALVATTVVRELGVFDGLHVDLPLSDISDLRAVIEEGLVVPRAGVSLGDLLSRSEVDQAFEAGALRTEPMRAATESVGASIDIVARLVAVRLAGAEGALSEAEHRALGAWIEGGVQAALPPALERVPLARLLSLGLATFDAARFAEGVRDGVPNVFVVGVSERAALLLAPAAAGEIVRPTHRLAFEGLTVAIGEPLFSDAETRRRIERELDDGLWAPDAGNGQWRHTSTRRWAAGELRSLLDDIVRTRARAKECEPHVATDPSATDGAIDVACGAREDLCDALARGSFEGGTPVPGEFAPRQADVRAGIDGLFEWRLRHPGRAAPFGMLDAVRFLEEVPITLGSARENVFDPRDAGDLRTQDVHSAIVLACIDESGVPRASPRRLTVDEARRELRGGLYEVRVANVGTRPIEVHLADLFPRAGEAVRDPAVDLGRGGVDTDTAVRLGPLVARERTVAPGSSTTPIYLGELGSFDDGEEVLRVRAPSGHDDGVPVVVSQRF